MNTGQLIALSYGGLLVAAVLAVHAVAAGSVLQLIFALGTATAVLVYFLRPHPHARKGVVLLALALPVALVAAGGYAWLSYEAKPTAPSDDPNNPAAWRLTAQERQSLVASCQRDLGIYESRLRALGRAPWSQYAEEQHVEWTRMLEQTARRCRALGGGADLKDPPLEESLREREAQETAQKEAAERERLARRLKIGDRVSAINDGHLKYMSGALSNKSRIYGTVVDAQFEGDTRERYAVKWDGGDTIWIESQRDLQRVPTTKSDRESEPRGGGKTTTR